MHDAQDLNDFFLVLVIFQYVDISINLAVLLCNQAPLYVEGWDEALHEIGKLSCETVLSPQIYASLLKAVENMPVLVIAGAEDALVPLKSSQVMASKLVNSVSSSLPYFIASCEVGSPQVGHKTTKFAKMKIYIIFLGGHSID